MLKVKDPINEASLTREGYKCYKNSVANEQKPLWQKTKIDGRGKKLYFINFVDWLPTWDGIAGNRMSEEHKNRNRWHVDVLLYFDREHLGASLDSFKVEIACNSVTTIHEVEELIFELWLKMNCCPDLLNND